MRAANQNRFGEQTAGGSRRGRDAEEQGLVIDTVHADVTGCGMHGVALERDDVRPHPAEGDRGETGSHAAALIVCNRLRVGAANVEKNFSQRGGICEPHRQIEKTGRHWVDYTGC